MKSDMTMDTVNEKTGIVDDSGNTVTVDTPGCTLHNLSELMSSTALWEATLNSETSSNVAMGSGSNGATSGGVDGILALTRRFEELYSKDLRLRSGSFGTVYTCHHQANAEVTYAVKIIDRKKLKKKDVTAVIREVKIMGELSQAMQTDDDNGSPHYIVQLVDFFVEPGSLYVVQEYAAGGDLFDRLTRRHHYTEKTARDVARQLLETVQFLHSRNPPIVHRDIKPENLLLKSQSEDTHILVADFGFARHVDPIDQCKTRCGTPSFVAPEILIGLSYDVTVDLWSVGCLLYMLVAGYTPFQAPHHRGLFRKIRAGDFIFHEQGWGEVSVESKRLISNLLTVNMDLRWTADRAVECAWFQDKKLEERLSGNDLSHSLVGMKQFVPKDAWKRAFHALGFCASAPFWDLDHSTFSQQMSKWDQEASAMHTSSSNMIHTLPRMKFCDRYELQKKIRKGSYATVWECIHKTTKELYAVKVIQRKGLKPEDDENVLNEVAVMQSLSADANKFVVQLLDFHEEDDYFYLVMEYCSGGDVFDRIVKYVQYTEMDARALSITLLRAVQSIHATGLAHRDIKPQNLFLLDKEDNASIRVGDFGFSKRVHTPESLTNRVGTPTYVAPEILKNLPHDERVDLWSVGIVIFVLLVGYPPFLDEDQSVLFKKIRTGEWVFFEDDWANISEDAKELLRGLLVVDPKERWTIEQCLTCQWIDHDPAHLSNNDLTDSIRNFKEKKNRLRGVAVGFKGAFDTIKAYALATSTAQQGQ